MTICTDDEFSRANISGLEMRGVTKSKLYSLDRCMSCTNIILQ